MASGERLQVVTAKDLLQKPMRRRTLLGGGVTAVVALAGCDGGEPRTNSSRIPSERAVAPSAGSGIEAVVYPLEQATRVIAGRERAVLVDKELEERPADGFEQVVFFYNPAYEGGSIDVALSRTSNDLSIVRVVSEEKHPRPGYLVDQTSMLAPEIKPVIKHPVIQLARGDQEVVYVATGTTPVELQQMRSYAIGTTNGTTLEGSFTGHTTLIPPLIMRE